MKKKVLFTSLACMSLLFSGLVACNNSASSSKQESKSESQPASSVQPSSEAKPESSSQPASTPDTSAPAQDSSSSSAVAHVHVFNEEDAEISKQPTCTEPGTKIYYCECGETKTETIKKLGHDFGEWTVKTAATCTEGGEEERECSRCHEKDTRTIEAKGHTWGEWTPKVGEEATCTEDGKEERQCSICGFKEERDAKAGHRYGEPTITKQNADGKDFYIKECSQQDSKYIGIAFDDYSAKDADFDAEANASKYKEVDESIWADARMLAKTKGTSISWKINVDLAIKGAQLSIGMTSTYESHKSTNMANQFKVKVNDGAATAWSVTGTYESNGLAPTKRTYLVVQTIDLVAGENTITLSLESTSNRLLLGGEVRISYAGRATIVDPTYVPFEGYNVTFVPGEHCKVYVNEGKDYTAAPVETNTCIAKDEDGNIVPYDVEDELPQPQVNFKVVCDEGWKVAKADIAVNGTFKNLKAGPDENEGLPDAEHFRITKVRTDLTVTITPVEDAGGEQNPGYVVDFVTSHCSVVVYVGDKDETGSNVDAGPAYYTRNKDNPANYSLNNGQTWFEVVPETGYKFVSGIEVGGEDGDGVPFVSGNYNKVKQTAANVYNITKINSDIAVSLKCIPEGGEEGLGYEITFVAEHCQILVYEDGQDYRFTPTAPVDGKTLSRNDNGDAAKYVAKVDGVDANGDGDYEDEGDTAPVAEVKPQVNFKVVPEEGYEFVSGIDANAEASGVSFVSGNYNKVKNMDNGIYRVTKIKGNLTITITATLIANA